MAYLMRRQLLRLCHRVGTTELPEKGSMACVNTEQERVDRKQNSK